MLGNSHRLVAGASWFAVASQAGLPGWQVTAGVVPAVAFSAGPTSPDVDNCRWWKTLDRWVPDEWLGEGGPLQHRGLLHWWGLPVVVAALLYVAGWRLPPNGFGEIFVWAALIGWTSHLAGDMAVGRAGFGTGRGVPVLPWWGHVGLGLKCGGPAELVLTPLAAAGLCWWAAGMPVDVLSVHEWVGRVPELIHPFGSVLGLDRTALVRAY